MRTRTRLYGTLGLVLATTVTAASIPWWPDGGSDTTASAPGHRDQAITAVTKLKDQATAVAEALRSGKEVLIEEATTATSQTWARPDGQLRSEFTAVPQRAKTGDGRWAAIDNTLRTTETGVQPLQPYTPVTFSNGSQPGAKESVLATVETKTGQPITYTWPGPLPTPTLDGTRALYSEVRTGVDLLVVARQEGGFGHVLIVKNREAATDKSLSSLTYGLRADGAVFRHDATTGGVRIHDAKTGAEVGGIPTPMAWDSAGKDPESPETPRLSVASTTDVLKLSALDGAEPGSKQTPMPSRLDGDGTSTATLHLDATGILSDPNVKFPVLLDPTINPGEQAWLFVSKSHANSN
ncbi:hypothetical protein ACFQV6_44060, partial [Actinoplanes sp. GCM10030250]